MSLIPENMINYMSYLEGDVMAGMVDVELLSLDSISRYGSSYFQGRHDVG